MGRHWYLNSSNNNNLTNNNNSRNMGHRPRHRALMPRHSNMHMHHKGSSRNPRLAVAAAEIDTLHKLRVLCQVSLGSQHMARLHLPMAHLKEGHLLPARPPKGPLLQTIVEIMHHSPLLVGGILNKAFLLYSSHNMEVHLLNNNSSLMEHLQGM